MLHIDFHPDNNDPALGKAAYEYQQIWAKESEKIVSTLEKLSGLRFIESFINAIVLEGISRSHPLSLRASYSIEDKKGALVHELAHRLLVGNGIQHQRARSAIQSHEAVNLFLYDAWVELWGEQFAKNQVEVESGRTTVYKEAWQSTISLSNEQRAARLQDLKNGKF